MKIFCIAHNYKAHARELDHAVPDVPVFFMKPETALLSNNKPFIYPEFSKEVHFEVEIVLKIFRTGKNIEEQYAGRYYNEVTAGIDFTARDIQRKCIEDGNPWEISKAFDNAAVIGKFLNMNQLHTSDAIRFTLLLNGKPVQEGNTADMVFKIDTIISHVSKFMTLEIGDLIFTGTPFGVGPVKPGDRLEGFIEDIKVFNFEVIHRL